MDLHFILQHLDSSGTYTRILFAMRLTPCMLCCRTSFPSSLGVCLTPPAGSSQTSCLTGGSMWSRANTSLTVGLWELQGWVLSPLLFSLYTNSCTSSHQSIELWKFADDTTVVGLIAGGDDHHHESTAEDLLSASAEEVQPVRSQTWPFWVHSHLILRHLVCCWYAKDKGRLQHIIGSAEKVISYNLPPQTCMPPGSWG